MNPNKTHRVYPKCICRLALAVLALASAGCTGLTRTEYLRPEVALPEQWQTLPDSGEQVLTASRWWRVFEDPQLNRLIAKALKTNNDLAVAAFKVRKARLKAGLEGTGLLPELSLKANSSTQKTWTTATGPTVREPPRV